METSWFAKNLARVAQIRNQLNVYMGYLNF